MKMEAYKEFVYVLYRNTGNKYAKTEPTAWEYLGIFEEKNDMFTYLYKCLSDEEREQIEKMEKKFEWSPERVHQEIVSRYNSFYGETLNVACVFCYRKS